MSLMMKKMWTGRAAGLLTATLLLAGAAMASTPKVSYESYWPAQENAVATASGANGSSYALSTRYDAQGSSLGCRLRHTSADGATTLLDRKLDIPGASCKALAVGAAGDITIGAEASVGATTTAEAYQSAARGHNIVVAKLASDGSTIYTTYYGGSGAETLTALALDAQDDVLLAGQSTSNDLPTANAWQASLHSGAASFIAKLSANGSSLVYASYLNFATVTALGVDAAGDAYVAGAALEGFNWRNAAITRSGAAAFLASFAADGAIRYATGVGLNTLAPTSIDALAVLGDELALAGSTTSNGVSSPYLLRVNLDGVTLVADGLPSAKLSGAVRLATDGAGALALAAPGSLLTSASPVQSAGESFVISLDASGVLNYATPVDGLTNAVAADADGNVHLLSAVGKLTPALRNAAVKTVGETLGGNVTPSISTQLGLATVNAVTANTTASWEITPNSVTFNGTPLGSISSPQVITITNNGAVPIAIDGFTFTGSSAFSQINSCGATLDNGKYCTVTIYFSPTADGTVNGNLIITPNSASGLKATTITLKGTAINALFIKSQSSDDSVAVTMSAGETAVYYLRLISAGTIAGNVTFSCYDMPAKADCKVTTPNGNALTANGELKFTMTVTTTGSTTGTVTNTGKTTTTSQNRKPTRLPFALALFGAMIWGSVVTIGRRRGKKGLRLSLLGGLLGLAMLLSMGGCGNSVEQATVTPTGSYGLVVDATVNGITQSVTVKMTIQ